MTNTTVFVGPSLRLADIDTLREHARANGAELDVRPPACRGDLVDLGDAGSPGTVLLLDGEFGQNLAVSIAEVRAVLETGMRLHGASSMGVLRAVECRTLGMTGSGWVYERYLSEEVDSDAEVALMFDPCTYEPVTIPLINIRWLIAEKVRAGEVSPHCGATALRLAAEVNFRDRRPSRLASVWRAHLGAEAGALEPDLADGNLDRWDRKRLDGIEALRAVTGA
ncbi:TfuA-like protein [Nonomuraea sp. KM88]|uniref:TfuA-like protein n=1 Tax=Nonomuraea sp. KM88 TaxID=3457427 RepID=UPI003FCD9647